MFPSVIDTAHNRPVGGTVFGYEVYYGGQVAQRRGATVNHDTWQECLKCSDLDSCYRVSTGKMLMELAVKTEPKSQQ
jgi:hypothetical protein